MFSAICCPSEEKMRFLASEGCCGWAILTSHQQPKTNKYDSVKY